MIKLTEIVNDSTTLSRGYLLRDGFVFTAITHPANVFDAIVIKHPIDASCSYNRLPSQFLSLEDHIEYINLHKLEKALVITNNLDFLTNCPTLKYLSIIPVDNTGNGFDYSPLYKMPQLKSVQCPTAYGKKEELSTTIDCQKINGIENIHVTNLNYLNFNTIRSLRSLGISNYQKTNLTEAFCSPVLDTLSVFQSKIRTLEGIQQSSNMQCLYLYNNKSLHDISALRKVKKTLKALRIENCPKITDFSVCGELANLELLELSGSNILPNIHFLREMKGLKTFIFSVNIDDGDLTPCLSLSYAYSAKNRKHYNLKDNDLPKKQYIRGNESIDFWRHLE